MLAASRICRASFPVAKTVVFISPPVSGGVSNSVKAMLRTPLVRNFMNENKESFTRTTRRRRTLKETIMQPTEGTPFAVGKAAVAGGAVLGIGALCFYGLGLANQAGAIDKSILWDDYVKERIKSTYKYLGSSVVLTAASAAACFRSPTIMRFMSQNSLLGIGVTMAAMIGSSMVVHSIPYEPGFGAKQMAWMVHTGVIGAVLAPLCFVAGPLALRAAVYTAGVVGGLSAVAVCAPSDKFLYMAGPLGIGLGVVFVSSIGSMFLAPTTALGAGLYSISLYGGLLLFSGFVLYDTQRVIRAAETYPVRASRPFDPVNASMALYLDAINIFVRILTILMGSERKRR